MVKKWFSLELRKQQREIYRSVKDIRYFYRSPYMLDFEPFKWQDEISHQLVHDNSVRDAFALIGMRAGKTTVGGSVSAYYLFRMSLLSDPAKHFGLLKKAPVRMTNMATSREQGKETIFEFFKNFVKESPYFQEVPDLEIYKEHIDLVDRNFSAVSLSSSSGSSVGKTSVLTCFDEADLFDDTEKKDGIQQVWTRVTKATKTLRKITNGEFGKTLTISSYGEFPMGGFMDRMIERAKYVDHMIWFKLATWDASPLYTKDDFKEDFETDYAATMRDFGCDARAVGSTYIRDEGIIEQVVNEKKQNFFKTFTTNRTYSPLPHGEYYITGDPSLKHDAFGLALGHTTGKTTEIVKERGKDIEIIQYKNLVIDGMWRLMPSDYRNGEIDPADVEKLVLDVLSHIPVRMMAFDTWNFPILQAKARRLGLIVDDHIVRKPDCDLLKNMMMYKAIELCDYPVFVREAKELMVTGSGKKVDHPQTGSKDVWDAVALQAWCANQLTNNTAPYNPAIAKRY